MRDTIFVSVVLPVYNESDRIEAVLLSLFNQHTKNELITHDTYELIVVDNNSTDDSVAKINAFSERHPAMAIHVIAETVQGVSSARKRGMDYASLRSKARDSRLGNKRKHYIVSADADCTRGCILALRAGEYHDRATRRPGHLQLLLPSRRV
ncbi:glycosyltransferase family 2 protein [Serratia ureilytica]|uniref:glycosyltransferase family 2 protein n=1 Tax=Serratia ureilytica TaxID=300181 RepID=UPI001F120320|nr:glycosyltransferase family A protein [Serratia ureilytica]